MQMAYEEADSENRAKTEFMNRMSHDIRTPINGIMGMVDIHVKTGMTGKKLMTVWIRFSCLPDICWSWSVMSSI